MTRRGLVVGAGGVTGLAWSSATLAALHQTTGWDPRDAGVLLGTSQGSLLVLLLAYGVGTGELVAWYRRELPGDHPLRHRPPAAEPPHPVPGVRRWLPGSPWLALRGLHWRRTVPAVVALSGLVPAGTQSLDGFLAPLTALHSASASDGAGAAGGGAGGWAPHPATWVVAVDYDSGARTCFGTPGAPPATLPEAVRASCTVPGVFPPTRIGDRRYVDGGVHSSTSADLLAAAPLDEVIVLAPMAGTLPRPRTAAALGDVLARRLMHRRLESECDQLRRAGLAVHVLTPSAEDLAAMAGNPLDPRRRVAVFEAAMRTAPARVAAALA